jgi:hypothetical protein
MFVRRSGPPEPFSLGPPAEGPPSARAMGPADCLGSPCAANAPPTGLIICRDSIIRSNSIPGQPLRNMDGPCRAKLGCWNGIAAMRRAKGRSRAAICPRCHRSSRRVHSRYRRTLADLSWPRRTVIINVTAQRFRCGSANCLGKIFAERMPDVAAPYGRRTKRLVEIQRRDPGAARFASGSPSWNVQ